MMLREMTSSAYAPSFKRFAQCVVVGFALAGLAACGGGGGGMTESMPEPAAPVPQDPALSAGEELATAMADGNLPLPSGHGIPGGRIEIPAGAYRDRNGLRFSCTGAEACVVAVDADGGRATVDAGAVRLARLPDATPPPVAMPEPEPAPSEPEPSEPEPSPPVAMPEPAPNPGVIDLPADHAMDSLARGTIEAGTTRHQYNVRFTCAAGGVDCYYTYIGDGRIRLASGALTVAPAPWPDNLIMDVARLQSILGGSALDWGSDQVLSELRARMTGVEPAVETSNHNYDSRYGVDSSGNRIRSRSEYFSRVPAGGDERSTYGLSGAGWGATLLAYDYRDDGNLVDALDDEARSPHGIFRGLSVNHPRYGIPLWLRDRAVKPDAVITDEHGITYVQTVSKDGEYPDPSPGTDYPRYWKVLGGLLAYADFWIHEEAGELPPAGGRRSVPARLGPASASASNAPGSASGYWNGPKHGASYRIFDPNVDSDGLRVGSFTGRCLSSYSECRNRDDLRPPPPENPIRATWNGSLIGIGHNKAYPDLYRKLIAGNVEITTDIARSIGVDVVFSDIKRVDTGEAVTLSTQRWAIARQSWPVFTNTVDNDEVGGFHAQDPDWHERDTVSLQFGGPDYSTAAGIFMTREALGAFGAKKQEE